ncbi:hypothetical protein GX51_03204 [Blastomyces parvus]|uniref:Carboxylic ester hydrolase n=1 Tax=Blastomyces parvus TaxID=2060905 RepID=A0A2B7X8C4_9EURO|nr:hypothetical protein GX51_03204 [Blastomyces parvus]
MIGSSIFFYLTPFLLTTFFFPANAWPPQNHAEFPNVDLGYAVHAPTFLNITASGIKLGNYNNIRYAQPPTGNLRFRNPRTPPPRQHGIQNGVMDPSPDCVSSAHPYVPFPGLNGTHWGTEDCLYLNVRVPEGVKPGDKVPVIHQVSGSAYAFGSKDQFYTSMDSIGLFDGIKSPEENFIFVSHNYRLGLYGWTSSPFEDMDANVGLHDSIAAVEWTKKYIDRFGGDPDRITVFGQSAGATIITMMLTGNAGQGSLPFSKAIISSPAILPRRNVTIRRQEVYESVLEAANCTTLACLRAVPETELEAVNHHLITEVKGASGGGAFGPGIGFAPLVDGSYVPDAPQVLLDQGRFNKNVKSIISANTLNEGQGVSPDSNMPENFPAIVRLVFPGASDATVKKIQDLFPVKEGEPAEKLAWDWTTSVLFACPAESVARAYSKIGKARRYFLSAPPATHGFDMLYFLHVNSTLTPVSDSKVALQSQSYLRNFIASKSAELPSPPGTPDWPLYGSESNTLNIGEKGFEVVRDPWVEKGICKTLMEIILDEENEA